MRVEPREIVALHGFVGSPADFSAVASSASPRWRWWCPRLPGHGSGAPGGRLPLPERPLEEPEANAAVLAWADATAAWVKARACGPSVLLGYSMGGRLALHLALRHPDLWDRLLLVGASAGLADPQERAARRESDERWARKALARGIGCFLDDWEDQPLLMPSRGFPKRWAEARKRRRLLLRPEGIALSIRTFGTGSLPCVEARLPELRMPVAWLAGEDDTKYSRLASRLAACCPGGSALVMPRTGHACLFEDPVSAAGLLDAVGGVNA